MIKSITLRRFEHSAHTSKRNRTRCQEQRRLGFTWDYSLTREPLRKLYEKAKTSQWNGTYDLDWNTEVDVEKTVAIDQAAIGTGVNTEWYADTKLAKWATRVARIRRAQSQVEPLAVFAWRAGRTDLHQQNCRDGAMVRRKVVRQHSSVDEARHVEVFARYLDEKLDGGYPINPHLGLVLDDIVKDSRWDFTYLGMQIMVEGLALAAFGYLHQLTSEPLLKKLLRYVMSDEARHVAFGVLSLKEVYDGMSDKEIMDRQEFAYEASIRYARSFLATRGLAPHGR